MILIQNPNKKKINNMKPKLISISENKRSTETILLFKFRIIKDIRHTVARSKRRNIVDHLIIYKNIT